LGVLADAAPVAWLTLALALINAAQTVVIAYLGIVAKRVNGQIQELHRATVERDSDARKLQGMIAGRRRI
jgi:hypothetical protein